MTSPNVRAAQLQCERDALQKRVDTAWASSRAGQYEDVLTKFDKKLKDTKATICRPLGYIKGLVSNNSSLYSTFYNQIDGKQRLPEDNQYDLRREQIDSAVFPGYHREIVFAALSLDGIGAIGYGGSTLVLRDDMIEHRASCFEANTFTFVKSHRVALGDAIPSGYRSTWEKRNDVAIAKLHSKIDKDTKEDEFSDILLEKNASTEANFVEVHIFGGFNRAAIEEIVFQPAKNASEKVIIKSITRTLKSIDIDSKVIS